MAQNIYEKNCRTNKKPSNHNIIRTLAFSELKRAQYSQRFTNSCAIRKLTQLVLHHQYLNSLQKKWGLWRSNLKQLRIVQLMNSANRQHDALSMRTLHVSKRVIPNPHFSAGEGSAVFSYRAKSSSRRVPRPITSGRQFFAPNLFPSRACRQCYRAPTGRCPYFSSAAPPAS